MRKKENDVADEPDYDRDDILLEVARLIWRKGMSISDFYSVLGVDLEAYRCDADHVVDELAGIFKGWTNPPDQDESA